MPSRIIMIAFIICSLFVMGVIGYNEYRELNKLYFVVDLETSASGSSQVFYDVGHGYNEQDSHSISIQRGKSQKLFFQLPGKAIKSIRFDPINVSAVVSVRDARIENKHGDFIKIIPVHDFRPIQQIDEMDTSDGALAIHTIENANDPILEIENSIIGNQVRWNDYITKRGLIIIGYGLMSLFFMIGVNYLVIFAKRNQYIISAVRYLKINLYLSSKQVGWNNFLIIILGISIVSLFSSMIAPFQSPDEFNHITRAYLLSKGSIILDAPAGNDSGGMIDSGLATYFAAYDVLPFKKDRKLSADEIGSAKIIKWSGIKEFRAIPNMAPNFPIIYMPQAIGLTLGEKLGLTINTSYMIARFMALLSVALILFAAFKIYPVNPLTIALLITPMSVFQFSSASLDGIATAVAILSIATFLRIATEKENSSPWHFYTLTLSVILVATSRAHLQTLLALVLVASLYIKKKKYFYVSAFAFLFVLAWLVIAIKTTIGFEGRVGYPPSSVALFYIKHPLAFFDVLMATLSNSNLVKFYWESFLGNLGWLDTQFSQKEYKFFSICTILIGLLSVSVKNLKTEWIPRFVLLFSTFFSILLIFISQLVAWTKHPASLIDGVQGRYFLVPAIMVAYAISGGVNLYAGIFRKIALLLVILLGAFTIFSTPRLLIERYYLALEQPAQISVVMRPSAPLEKNKPITLSMSKVHRSNLQPLKRMGIQCGTYIRKNSGSAELRLANLDGHVLKVPFDLSDLDDNQYKYFELDSKSYSSSQILYLTGGGMSTWEAHEKKGSVETCLIFEYTNGKRSYT